MRVVIQRVSKASVFIEQELAGSIDAGLVILLGIDRDDTSEDLKWMVNKVPQLRLFSDEAGKMNRSVVDLDGGIAVVSQFTLFGNVRKGTRPSFNRSADPEKAIPLYEAFVRAMEIAIGKPVVTGKFGAAMNVELNNDGPVTLVIDSRDKRI